MNSKARHDEALRVLKNVSSKQVDELCKEPAKPTEALRALMARKHKPKWMV